MPTDLLPTMSAESRGQRWDDGADWPLTGSTRHDRIVVVVRWGGQLEGVTVAAKEYVRACG